MEYCGYNLVEEAQRQRLSYTEIETLFGNLISALSHVHSKRIIHRDVKPANIMVKTRSDKAIIGVLGDFGISREADDIPCVGGTRSYRAPESDTETPKTALVDVWSLGVVIMEYSFGLPVEPKPFKVKLFTQSVNECIMQQGSNVKQEEDRPREKLHSVLTMMLVLEQEERSSAKQCLARWKEQREISEISTDDI